MVGVVVLMGCYDEGWYLDACSSMDRGDLYHVARVMECREESVIKRGGVGE